MGLYHALVKLIEGYNSASEDDKAAISKAFQIMKRQGFPFETAFALAVLNRKQFLEVLEKGT